MFSGLSTFIALGVFTFVSGIVSKELENRGKKGEAQTVNLITRIVFWAIFAPQFLLSVKGILKGFNMDIRLFNDYL